MPTSRRTRPACTRISRLNRIAKSFSAMFSAWSLDVVHAPLIRLVVIHQHRRLFTGIHWKYLLAMIASNMISAKTKLIAAPSGPATETNRVLIARLMSPVLRMAKNK